jgi:hypothetical protein
MATSSAHVILLRAEHGELNFTIESEGPEVGGYFLWAKRADGTDVDELFEDSVERCKQRAEEKYGVPLQNWHE